MIDDNIRLILVENPKCASAALKQMLTGNAFQDAMDPRTATMNHNLPAQIRQRYPEKWREYRSFVVVRNTWDRELSFFTYHGVLFQEPSMQNYNFESWVAAGMPRPEEPHLQIHYPKPNGSNHFLSQIEYTKGVDRVICLHSFDPAVRASELEQAVNALSQDWGFPVYPVHKHVNASRTDLEAMAWTKESITIIGQVFSLEIERYGFQPPEASTMPDKHTVR